MTRPLLITDCDEVLLHMVRHFGAWLDAKHAIDFAPEGGAFATALRRRDGGRPVPEQDVWPLLNGFFRTEMARQTPVPGAIEALRRIAAVADVVILTNLEDWCHDGRVEQLAAHGLHHRVVCNQGGKGAAVARLLAEFTPPVAVFVDDLPVHHVSVGAHAPAVWRLHLVAEPSVADTIPPAPSAHERIDDWASAAEWVLDRLNGGRSALDAPLLAEESEA